MKNKQRFLVGAHMSISGGFDKAMDRGESIGCTTLQIFTKSNRQWRAKPIVRKEEIAFAGAVKQTGIWPVVAHASYLINIGSPNAEVNKKSVAALLQELKRCDQLAIPYLVLHPGSHVGTDEQSCLERIVKKLNDVLGVYSGDAMILLETMAGQGSTIGYRFNQLAFLRKNCAFKQKIGICFDTCHAFAAGYDFRTKKGYESMWHEFDDEIGLKHLKAIHLNDSKKACDSRVDRHEDIGKGKIGLEAFKLLVNDERFFAVPKILETPKDSLEDDARNLRVLHELLTAKTKKVLQES